jgi:hypothetical protein
VLQQLVRQMGANESRSPGDQNLFAHFPTFPCSGK